MICFFSDSYDIYENLAIEIYLLENFTENFLFIYHNFECIIIGRNQIISREVNNEYIYENDIPIVRRISGGGAVFHDPGNINFSFIVNRKRQSKRIKLFNYFIKIFFQNEFNINLCDSGDNIYLNDLKISGSAQYFKGERQLHHGTLLFNVDLEKLKKSLRNNNYSKYVSRAQISKKANITNICNIFPLHFDINDIKHNIGKYINISTIDSFIDFADIKFSKLKEKLHSAAWLFNQPDYSFHNSCVINDENIDIHFDVQKHRIINYYASDDTFYQNYPIENHTHSYNEIYELCGEHKIAEIFF